MPPVVEGLLTSREITEALAAEHLGFQRAMKALVLALGLRVERPTVGHPHAKPHQPDGEAGVRLMTAIAPRGTIVHQHRKRQAIAAEHGDQLPAHGRLLLIAARRNPQRIARMVIEHRQRMTAPSCQRKVAFEVHLPQLVGFGTLEASTRTRMLLTALVELAVATQDLGDRARHRHLHPTRVLQHPFDLAATPRVVALLPNPQNLRLHGNRCPRWTAQRAARAIRQPTPAFCQIPLQPLVTVTTTDAEAPAQRALVRSRRQRQPHELLTFVHDRPLPPRHRDSPCPTARGRTSVLDVSERGARSVLDVPGLYTHKGEGNAPSMPRRYASISSEKYFRGCAD
jgi:hypothetical protein